MNGATMTRLALLLLLVVAAAPRAHAWESETHAGLTEQAAIASGVHEVLVRRHGRALGWYATATVPPQAAPALFEKLGLIPPSSGYSPDVRGRQSLLGWLLAGSVIEDIPAERGANHFARAIVARAGAGGLLSLLRGGARTQGKAATDWVVDPTNDLSISRFWRELELSAVAATAEERDQHLAYALLGAGAVLHVLQDMASPSRARGDFAAHRMTLGAGPRDLGSRFERLASLLYGRLGVPDPAPPPARTGAGAFFTSPSDGKGLADLTAARWFSPGTLPRPAEVPSGSAPAEVRAKLDAALLLPAPRIDQPLAFAAAAGRGGEALRDADGVCLAHYRYADGTLTWDIPDECAAEQIAAILPTAGGYAQGLLGHLFRGELAVAVADGEVRVTTRVALGAGAVRVLVEDEQGMRREIGAGRVDKGGAGEALAAFPLGEAKGVRVVAVYRGVDGAGEELVAVGQTTLR